MENSNTRREISIYTSYIYFSPTFFFQLSLQLPNTYQYSVVHRQNSIIQRTTTAEVYRQNSIIQRTTTAEVWLTISIW